MEGIGQLHGWQWVFILEGLAIIPLGLFTYVFLANIPEAVRCKIYDIGSH